MRKLLASMAVLCFAAGASAQDTPVEAHGQACDFTDGSNEASWKVGAPSGPSDWWNVCLGTDCTGVKYDALFGTAYFPGGEDQAYLCEKDQLYLSSWL